MAIIGMDIHRSFAQAMKRGHGADSFPKPGQIDASTSSNVMPWNGPIDSPREVNTFAVCVPRQASGGFDGAYRHHGT